MTYEQSLLNIEMLLNLISPFGDGEIFFNFSDSTHFKVEFFDANDPIYPVVKEKRRSGLPAAGICQSDMNIEVFYYYDINGNWKFNLYTNEFYFFSAQERPRLQYPNELVVQMQQLIRKLKNG